MTNPSINIVKVARKKFRFFKQPEIHDGIFAREFPDQGRHQPDQRQSGAGNDEVRFKPVLALPLIQNYLQESQAHTQQAQPNEVDPDSRLKPFAHEEGRVKNQEESKNQGDHSHRNVDEENPSPAITVGEPTTQGGTDDGRHDHAHAEHGHRHALLFLGKTLQQDGLRDGLQRSPSGALQDAEKHQPAKTGREPAEHGADA